MSTADDESDARIDRLGQTEPASVNVGLDMVDSHNGFVPSKRQGFGCRESYDERTGQSWESRYGDGAERIGMDSGLFERRVEYWKDSLKVRTSGDLGDHAGKLLM